MEYKDVRWLCRPCAQEYELASQQLKKLNDKDNYLETCQRCGRCHARKYEVLKRGRIR